MADLFPPIPPSVQEILGSHLIEKSNWRPHFHHHKGQQISKRKIGRNTTASLSHYSASFIQKNTVSNRLVNISSQEQ
jgi:hypothetical protein